MHLKAAEKCGLKEFRQAVQIDYGFRPNEQTGRVRMDAKEESSVRYCDSTFHVDIFICAGGIGCSGRERAE